MSMRDLTRLTIKLMGLFTLTNGILYGIDLPGLILLQAKDQTPQYIALGVVLPFLLEIALGIIFLRADAPLTDSLIFRHNRADAASIIDLGKAEQIGVALMGLYIAATGIPMFVQDLFYNLRVVPNAFSGRISFWDSDLFRSSLRVLIGAGLFVGSRGLVNLRHKLQDLRDAGNDRSASE